MLQEGIATTLLQQLSHNRKLHVSTIETRPLERQMDKDVDLFQYNIL